jgi:hypothetical protein
MITCILPGVPTITAFGIGFTVMVNVMGVPTQLTPLVYVGVTVIVPVIGALVALVPMKDGISPLPVPARPIEGLLFVQLYTMLPPVVGLLKFTAVVGEPLHTVWLLTALTVAVGFTVIEKLVGDPVHPPGVISTSSIYQPSLVPLPPQQLSPVS